MHAPLTLYHLSTCPFCLKVRRAADRLGIELRLVDIRREPAARRTLVERRAPATVPVLGRPGPDGEILLGESDDIVEFLEQVARDRASTAAA